MAVGNRTRIDARASRCLYSVMISCHNRDQNRDDDGEKAVHSPKPRSRTTSVPLERLNCDAGSMTNIQEDRQCSKSTTARFLQIVKILG